MFDDAASNVQKTSACTSFLEPRIAARTIVPRETTADDLATPSVGKNGSKGAGTQPSVGLKNSSEQELTLI